MGNKAIIIGGTQGTGALIAHRLLSEGWSVSVLGRTPEKAEREFTEKPVNMIQADISQPSTLPDFSPYDAIVLTAGVTKRPAAEALIRATEYEGTRHILQAAKASGFAGRFLYMTSIGGKRSSFMATMLNLAKGNTLEWRNKGEALIRESGLAYTILRAGLLNDKPAGAHKLHITQGDTALTLGTKLSRADAADLLCAALVGGYAINATFNAVWGEKGSRQGLAAVLASLQQEAAA